MSLRADDIDRLTRPAPAEKVRIARQRRCRVANPAPDRRLRGRTDDQVRMVRALRLLNVSFAAIVEITGISVAATKPWCHTKGRVKRLRESAGEPTADEIRAAGQLLVMWTITQRERSAS